MTSMLTLLGLDVAHDTITDRLQQAARDALADQLRQTRSAPSEVPFGLPRRAAPRHWLASGLRGLAAHLDPSASVADASLSVMKGW